MANNDHKINLEDNSKYRVAYDLMKQIAYVEDNTHKDREYFLRLYRQSYDSVNGFRDIDEVVTGNKKAESYNLGFR